MEDDFLSEIGRAKTVLDPKCGPPVSGDAFWSRPRPMMELLSRLEIGSSASLFGLRRIGKSSLMQEAARLLGDQGWTCITLRAEGMSGIGRFLMEIVNGLTPATRGRIAAAWAQNGNLPGALQGLAQLIHGGPVDVAGMEDDFRAYWEPLTEEVERQLRASDAPVVAFIDELPFFCQDLIDKGADRSHVINLLATLRRWRQSGDGANGDGRVVLPQVLCGSIGMVGFLREQKIDRAHNNDAPGIHIPPLDETEARGFIAALANGYGIADWSDALTEAVIEVSVELYPSYLQEVMLKLHTEARLLRIAGGPVDAQALQETLGARVMPGVRAGFEKEFFKQYTKRVERLGAHDAAWPGIAEEVLRRLREAPAPVGDVEAILNGHGIRDSVAAEFMDILEEEALTISRSGTLALGDRILAAWIDRRYGLET